MKVENSSAGFGGTSMLAVTAEQFGSRLVEFGCLTTRRNRASSFLINLSQKSTEKRKFAPPKQNLELFNKFLKKFIRN